MISFRNFEAPTDCSQSTIGGGLSSTGLFGRQQQFNMKSIVNQASLGQQANKNLFSNNKLFAGTGLIGQELSPTVLTPPEDWACFICTYINAKDLTSCRMCSAEKTFRVRSILASSNLCEVTQDTQEFNIASGHFSRLLNRCPSTVSQVDVIQYGNQSPVRLEFEKTKSDFEAEGKGTLVWIFHGTPADKISPIISSGFKAGGTEGIPVANGKVYGSGVYTATGPSTPMGYGRDKVILAVGLVGDRVHDSRVPCSDWIIFNSGRQLLPVYVIHFERTQPSVPQTIGFTQCSQPVGFRVHSQNTIQDKLLNISGPKNQDELRLENMQSTSSFAQQPRIIGKESEVRGCGRADTNSTRILASPWKSVPPTCGKCSKQLEKYTSVAGWTCDWGTHKGPNGNFNVMYSCETCYACNWCICETCYKTSPGHNLTGHPVTAAPLAPGLCSNNRLTFPAFPELNFKGQLATTASEEKELDTDDEEEESAKHTYISTIAERMEILQSWRKGSGGNNDRAMTYSSSSAVPSRTSSSVHTRSSRAGSISTSSYQNTLRAIS